MTTTYPCRFLLPVLFALAACRSSRGVAEECAPSVLLGCECSNGSEGTSVCLGDGSGQGPCDCSGAAPLLLDAGRALRVGDDAGADASGGDDTSEASDDGASGDAGDVWSGDTGSPGEVADASGGDAGVPDAGQEPEAAAPGLVITCGSGGGEYAECSCSVTGTPGTSVSHTGLSFCGNGNPSDRGTPDDLCCESQGYPASGSSCTCLARPEPWSCGVVGDSCNCGFGVVPYLGETPTSGCNDSPGDDGNPWVCCFEAGASTCNCTEQLPGLKIECKSQEQLVSNCASAGELGLGAGTPGATACPTETTSVDNCYYTGPTMQAQCSTNDECGGCSGNCCAICTNGECMPFCS